MQTKLTLDLDEALIRKAERWAQQHRISISDVIANFLRQLPDLDQSLELDPWTQSLVRRSPLGSYVSMVNLRHLHIHSPSFCVF